jgi:uncharacterized protein DUF1707
MFDRARSPEARSHKLKVGERRVSDADRADAIRRLRVHESMGRLDKPEAEERIAAVEASRTPDEIAQLFVDLPALPARPPSVARRISSQDRQDAIHLLEKAYSEGRMKPEECARAKDQVHAARTRTEIDAAFHGLSTPTRVVAEETATKAAKTTATLTARALVQIRSRTGKAFRRAMLAVGALLIGIILAVAGIGTGALIAFLLAVVLFVGAAMALVASSS